MAWHSGYLWGVFFNPACPCSRFNLRYVKQLPKNYGKDVAFLAVEPANFTDLSRRPPIQPAQAHGGRREGQLARACGVYTTPQAAMVEAAGKRYYRGNYHKNRYCTSPYSNYTQMAINSLLASMPAPTLNDLAPPHTAANCPIHFAIRFPPKPPFRSLLRSPFLGFSFIIIA
jgi:hypothetical protein